MQWMESRTRWADALLLAHGTFAYALIEGEECFMRVLRDTVCARDLMGRLIVPDARFARYRLREYEDGRILLEPLDPSEKAEAEGYAGVRAALGRLGLGAASAPQAGAEGAAATGTH